MTGSGGVQVTAGPGIAIVGDDVVVLVRATPDDPLVRRLWATVRTGAGFTGTVEALRNHGFTPLPDLAVLGSDGDERRVLLRGAVTASMAGRDAADRGGTPPSDGSECVLSGDGAVRVQLEPAPLPSTPAFDVDRGMTPAGAVLVGARGAAAAAPSDPIVAAPDRSWAECGLAAVSGPIAPRAVGHGIRPDDEVPVDTVPSRPPPVPPADDPRTVGRTRFDSPPPPGPDVADSNPTVQPSPTIPPPSNARPVVVVEPRLAAHPRDEGHDLDLDLDRTFAYAELDGITAVAPDGADLAPVEVRRLAVRCPAGHPNPPHAETCRGCRAAVAPQEPETVEVIDLGRFRFSTGAEVPVVRSMLIGRAPRVGGGLPGTAPELVAVPSPDHDVSRTHVEVRLEGWQVLVIDRRSTNGTVVTLPGGEPQRLRPDVPFPLPVGARVSLAGEVDFELVVEP